MYKSVLSMVNGAMRRQVICNNIEELEKLFESGQLEEVEFKDRKNKILSLIDKLPESDKEINAEAYTKIKKNLDNMERMLTERLSNNYEK